MKNYILILAVILVAFALSTIIIVYEKEQMVI